ncbi:MAG: hypothetical protein OCD76_06830 [Reichenbachiella sp.]
MVFSLFKKSSKYEIPEDYKSFVSQKDFDKIIELSLHHLKNLDFDVKSIDGGQITINQETEDDDRHFFLDNLVRRIAQLEQAEWSEEILSHYSKLQDHSAAYKFLFKDFEHASKYLKVLIKADDLLSNAEEYVSQTNFPETLTFLVLDFEEQFHYVRKDEILEWEISTDELFRTALDNISNEEIDIKEYLYEDQFQVFALFSGDFASAYSIELDRNVSFATSELGTLLAIPTKGTAFLHPISSDNIIDLITILYPTVEEFFNEDTGNINTNFYWFYKGSFFSFPKKTNDDGTLTISLPNKLSNLLNT